MHHDLPSFFEALGRNEEGQGVIEYALGLSFVTLVCVAAVTGFGAGVNGLLTRAASSFPHP